MNKDGVDCIACRGYGWELRHSGADRFAQVAGFATPLSFRSDDFTF